MNTVEDNGDGPLPPAALKPSSIITNGAVSGVLPDSTVFAVNYPGYPSSLSRAVDTLGGLDEIAEARRLDSNQLELRFRPEDPYSHPAFGDRRRFTGLLLKISRTRTEPDHGDKEQLSAEVVARVNEAYDFEGMVDYQHVLAVHAAESRRKKRRCVFEEEKDSEGDADVMMLVPPLFSLKNRPEEIVLNPSTTSSSRNLQRSIVEHRWEMDIEPCLQIDFNIDKVPERFNWEDKIPRDSTEWELQSAVSKLFEARPIWPRRSIHEQLLDDGLHVTVHTLKRFLFRSGYYFCRGPFARFWIRKGYDPRKDPESRKFQKVEFRIRPELRKISDTNTNVGSKQKWKSICQFEVFPWQDFTSLQFFELDDDFIRDELQKPTDRTTCTIEWGWFSKLLHSTLTLRVRIRFLSLCSAELAKSLLRSLTEDFEKRKKALSRITKRVTEHPYLTQDSDLNSELVRSTSNVTEHRSVSEEDPSNFEIDNDGEGEDEEEDEGEDEEEDCELDARESPPMVIEDGRFTSETSAYNIGDGIGSNYLQDVLKELPFCKDGKDTISDKEVQDADSSDGEYQIYEQDSDSFDDDEDGIS